MKIPSSHEFPITFERALRLAVGGRDEPERFRVFRAWWKSELLRIAGITGVVTDNVQEMVVHYRTKGVDQCTLNCMCSGIAQFKAGQRRERMSNLAKTRWRKKVSPVERKTVLAGKK